MKHNLTTADFSLEHFAEAIAFLADKLEAIEKRLPTAPNDTPAVMPKLLTRKQLCAYLQVSHVTVRKWEKRGDIPYTLCGADARYNLKDVLAALEKMKAK